jgi:hypothetical protein
MTEAMDHLPTKGELDHREPVRVESGWTRLGSNTPRTAVSRKTPIRKGRLITTTPVGGAPPHESLDHRFGFVGRGLWRRGGGKLATHEGAFYFLSPGKLETV